MFRFAVIETNDVDHFKYICFQDICRKISFLSIILILCVILILSSSF